MGRVRAGQDAEEHVSKTDKTRPWWVRTQDLKLERPRQRPGDSVGREYATYQHWLGGLRCGCAQCVDQPGRKRQAPGRSGTPAAAPPATGSTDGATDRAGAAWPSNAMPSQLRARLAGARRADDPVRVAADTTGSFVEAGLAATGGGRKRRVIAEFAAGG